MGGVGHARQSQTSEFAPELLSKSGRSDPRGAAHVDFDKELGAVVSGDDEEGPVVPLVEHVVLGGPPASVRQRLMFGEAILLSSCPPESDSGLSIGYRIPPFKVSTEG